jgi:hypothetical protein
MPLHVLFPPPLPQVPHPCPLSVLLALRLPQAIVLLLLMLLHLVLLFLPAFLALLLVLVFLAPVVEFLVLALRGLQREVTLTKGMFLVVLPVLQVRLLHLRLLFLMFLLLGPFLSLLLFPLALRPLLLLLLVLLLLLLLLCLYFAGLPSLMSVLSLSLLPAQCRVSLRQHL